MKRILLSVGVVLLAVGVTMAQNKNHEALQNVSANSSSMTTANMAFENESHDFGTVPEGPSAVYEFKFKNTGSQPIVLQRVQASCGCTTPYYSKDPVLPGKEGDIKASYNTNGRPGPFVKTITIVSNAGTKVITIKGSVEKAPSSSVPENTSMIKTN